MKRLPFERPAYFALGAMLTVLVTTPAKAYCSPIGTSYGDFAQCVQQENRMQELEHRQQQLEQRDRWDFLNRSLMPTFPSRRTLY